MGLKLFRLFVQHSSATKQIPVLYGTTLHVCGPKCVTFVASRLLVKDLHYYECHYCDIEKTIEMACVWVSRGCVYMCVMEVWRNVGRSECWAVDAA